MIFFERNKDIIAVLDPDSPAGEYQFCRFCRLEEKCGKSGLPKILPINQIVLNYLYEELNGRMEYPYPGSWEHQPSYFIKLLATARQIQVQCSKDKMNGK